MLRSLQPARNGPLIVNSNNKNVVPKKELHRILSEVDSPSNRISIHVTILETKQTMERNL